MEQGTERVATGRPSSDGEEYQRDGGLLTRWLAANINKQEESAAGGVYSLPLETWSVLTCLIGALILLRAVVRVVAGS